MISNELLWRRLDWNLVRVFHEIVERGGVSAAARSLGRQQPATSQALSRLEEQLGVTLCERGPGGFALTPEGEIVFRISRQMVELMRDAPARALAAGPLILLMDEPFGSLDADTRWRMQELLLEIVGKNRLTVLMVTHDVDEALFVADKIAILSKRPGRLLKTVAPGLRSEAVQTKEQMVSLPAYGRLHGDLLGILRAQHLE